MPEYPFVIWTGKQPLQRNSARLCRVIHRGPARPNRKDDVPFTVEQRIGCDSMKQMTWAKPVRDSGGEQEAVFALVHAFGQFLTVDPKKLDLNHPFYCECNTAVAEGRESRGCDCGAASDPVKGDKYDQ
jgi:hypothetical protein